MQTIKLKMKNELKRLIAILLTATAITSCTLSVHAATDNPIELYNEWDPEVKSYATSVCKEKDLPLELVLAIIYNESRFQSDATNLNSNGTTDWGLMQINDVCFDFVNTYCDINDMQELLDPYAAIDCGVELLRYHKDVTGDDSLALLRYQVGAGAYKKLLAKGQTTTDTHTFVIEIAEQFYDEFERKSLSELSTA